MGKAGEGKTFSMQDIREILNPKS